jgi:hypothetical protein
MTRTSRLVSAAFFACVTALTLLTSAAGAAPSRPQQFGTERISEFGVALNIQADGSVDVTEDITYDFGGASRHGIYRVIPTRFPYVQRDSSGKVIENGRKFERLTRLVGFQVSSPDAPSAFSQESSGANESFKIGDANTFVSGVKHYRISYRLEKVLNGFPDHDELYLNAVGNGWQVPIDRVTVSVTAPGALTRVSCFQGPDRSTDPCATATFNGSEAEFSATDLGANSGTTVVVGMAKGVVAEPTAVVDELWTIQRAFDTSGARLPVAAGGLLAGLAALGLLFFRRGRDRRFRAGGVDAAFGQASGEEVPVPLFDRIPNPVEFTPPEGIRPGHLGTLIDEVANPLDVSAMIVDLAVRGYLRIEEVAPPEQRPQGASSGDYRFVQLRVDDPELTAAERLLLQALFQDGPAPLLSDLRAHFRSRLELVQGALYDDVVRMGWFSVRPDRTRSIWAGLGVTALVAGLAGAFVLIRFTNWGFAGVVLPVLGLVLVALSSKMPSRTGRGTAMVGRVRGFKQIFEVGEGERQRFAEDLGMFSRYLPYAMVFGYTERWAQTFAALGATPEQMGIGTWYVSPYALDPFYFGWVMGSFGTTTSGSIAMATPTSVSSGGAGGGFSGFGGGGFSGGGFGGGGGGSW